MGADERFPEEGAGGAGPVRDVVVVGGGPAGLSAALTLARARRSVAVVDSATPRNAAAGHVHGFLSRDGTPPGELLAAGRAEVASYGAELIDGTARSARRRDGGFVVRLGDGRRLAARRLLVAAGLRDELPGLPGVRERWGRDVLYCPYCHGYEVRDQPLGVLATQQCSIEEALHLRQWSPDTVLFTHTTGADANARRRLAARGVRVVDGEVRRVAVVADRLHGVELADGRLVPRRAVFVTPRFASRGGLLDGLGCARTQEGWPEADGAGRTSVPGVWAAGNVVDPTAQLVTAAGAGAHAAIGINAELVEEDTVRDLARTARTPAAS
ncbi:NAD(P)/FAD-dependent oxidoreductase [Streptomyces sp. MST-110588]|uniref:NAD(P)/FAD-dependent oxidoreductase n=1 Tax=Streptomyces sp. MST-110588 TaxID=2833628 RepID=UPI001F5D4C5C|nr:NAD(P)/FAD-dependent oxidoreductase [Streptomyces sp. MST-110588]UNO40021.1 NAD(P)/FAD-dependent oxidoreductase [Streptomyces sp. MST-110588]